jgi:hypothetical protein
VAREVLIRNNGMGTDMKRTMAFSNRDGVKLFVAKVVAEAAEAVEAGLKTWYVIGNALDYVQRGSIMRMIAIGLASMSILVGCASKPVYEEPSIKLSDGTRQYSIKTSFKPCQSSRDWAVRTLAKRANKICKTGYTLIQEQALVSLAPPGTGTGDRELSWQFKCKSPDEPRL